MKIIDEIKEQVDLTSVFREGIYFLSFFILLVILCIISFFVTGQFFPSNETNSLWFYSGLVMVLFTTYFVEPFYTAPTNVFVNSFALVLMMISIPQKEFGNSYWWWAGLIFFACLMCGSFVSKTLRCKNKSDDFSLNRISNFIKDVFVVIGRGKVLFSIVFFYFLVSNYAQGTFSDAHVLLLLIFWAFVALLPPEWVRKIIGEYILNKILPSKTDSLGKIFAVQSEGMFLARLFDNKTTSKFSTVVFQNQISRDEDNLFLIGFIFDIYFLDNQKWAKVVSIRKATEEENTKLKALGFKKDFIYSTPIDYISKEVTRFVGVIAEGSNVGRINFEYSEKSQELEEGRLLELTTRGKKLFYQAVNADTHKEKLESWNETGFIVGQAIQLGGWKTNLSFEKFGWVPPINTPVFLADTSSEEASLGTIVYPEYQLGVIPGTKLPSVINLQDAVSHHMAILGVTGSGKSFITHEIINELKKDTKIICIDFTEEYRAKFKEKKITIAQILNKPEGLKEVEAKIAEMESARANKYPDKAAILKFKKEIQDKLTEYIEAFMGKRGPNIGLFELPELSNTTFLLEFTQLFIEAVFNYAKSKKGKGRRIVLVLEEAHTIVPETNFLGDLGDYGSNKALVSKMSQVALQGRKYKVGLLVIGQRSANISKTVLTQCNTVISFKAFDDTSFGFLSNYLGKDLVNMLPNLKQYHAIVTGKAVKSDTPMVIDFTRKENGN